MLIHLNLLLSLHYLSFLFMRNTFSLFNRDDARYLWLLSVIILLLELLKKLDNNGQASAQNPKERQALELFINQLFPPRFYSYTIRIIVFGCATQLLFWALLYIFNFLKMIQLFYWGSCKTNIISTLLG